MPTGLLCRMKPLLLLLMPTTGPFQLNPGTADRPRSGYHYAFAHQNEVAGRPFRGWPHFDRATFVKRFYQPVLRPKLSSLRYGAKGVAISAEDFNMLVFDSKNFQAFLTDCGEHFRGKYPAFNVVFTEVGPAGQRNYEHQQHFAFIRTAEGYRLFSVSL